MTLGEYMFGCLMAAGNGSNAGARPPPITSRAMADPAALDKLRNRRNYYSDLVPAVPPRYRRLREGDAVTIGARTWRVVTGFGHSPEHCALQADGVLISGDMVLPRISTNVSVFDLEPEANPLALYLQSLGRYETMAPETLVLPSHGKPFRGVRTRITQLREHHDAAEVRVACAEQPMSAADIVPIMFRRRELDIHQMTFARRGARAPEPAVARGWLREQGADGVIRFTR